MERTNPTGTIYAGENVSTWQFLYFVPFLLCVVCESVTSSEVRNEKYTMYFSVHVSKTKLVSEQQCQNDD